jgi:hypothetical protein
MATAVRTFIAVGFVLQCALADADVMLTQMGSFNLNPLHDPSLQATFFVSSDSTNLPPTIINMNSGTRTVAQATTFSQFSSALGTLNSVAISFLSTYTGTSTLVSAVNGNVQDGDFVDFFANGRLSLVLSGLLIPTQSLSPQPAPSAECAHVHGSSDVTPPGTCSNQTATASGSFGNSGISPLTLGNFIGSGVFNLTATLSSTLSPAVSPDNGTGFADNATFNGTLDSNWQGTVEVIYDYTPAAGVPEPFTLYLVAGGLAGIGLMRRRRM